MTVENEILKYNLTWKCEIWVLTKDVKLIK